MIKRIALTLLFPSLLSAQNASSVVVADGCYFQNNVSMCAGTSVFCSTNEIRCYDTAAANIIAFGDSLGMLCNRYLTAYADAVNQKSLADNNAAIATNYLAAFNSCKAEKDNCNATLTATSTSNLSNILELSKQKQLVSKLRKACGSKCKKIK